MEIFAGIHSFSTLVIREIHIPEFKQKFSVGYFQTTVKEHMFKIPLLP